MSPEQDVAVVQRMLEAYAAGAPERALEFLDPDVEFDATVRPDGRVWRGREEVRRAMREWADVWDDFEMNVERCIDAGGGRVVMLWNEHGRAKGSGVPLAQSGVMLFELRAGRIVAMAVHLDRQGVLEGLGLPSGGA
jgi:ketosteroid isomerase-like protein